MQVCFMETVLLVSTIVFRYSMRAVLSSEQEPKMGRKKKGAVLART